MNEEEILDKGKLWFSFQSTDYALDLNQFFAEQETLARQSVCDLTIAGAYEEAKAAAHKLSGILAVKEYINDCVSGMNDIIEREKEDKKYRKAIPRHI